MLQMSDDKRNNNGRNNPYNQRSTCLHAYIHACGGWHAFMQHAEDDKRNNNSRNNTYHQRSTCLHAYIHACEGWHAFMQQAEGGLISRIIVIALQCDEYSFMLRACRMKQLPGNY